MGMRLWTLPLISRRLLMFSLSLLVTIAASAFLIPAFRAETVDLIDLVAAALFITIMLAGSFNFWLFVFGFLLARDRYDAADVISRNKEVTTRTAVVMPVYNEDAERVY